jgi:hypothetical protein
MAQSHINPQSHSQRATMKRIGSVYLDLTPVLGLATRRAMIRQHTAGAMLFHYMRTLSMTGLLKMLSEHMAKRLTHQAARKRTITHLRRCRR